MRIPLLSLALSLASVGCHKTVVHTGAVATAPDTLVPGLVIKSAGNWSAHTGKSSRTLDVTVSGNSVSWTVSSEEQIAGGGKSGGSSSSSMTLSSPTDPWFILVESPQRLWFFNGTGNLAYSLSDGGIRSGPAIHGGKLIPTDEKIPAILIRQLPAELQKLFPPVPPEEERPSF